MIHYRIYTADMNYDILMELAGLYFREGFTVHTIQGFWQGKRECSLLLEIYSACDSLDGRANDFVRTIKAMNNQEAVLVVRDIVDARMV